MFLLSVQIDGHGTLLFTELFSPAAFPAACSRGWQPRVRPFADEVSLKVRERPPPGIVVSMDSVMLWNPIRSGSSSAIRSIKCLSNRPCRSSRQTARRHRQPPQADRPADGRV
jgi:hypothetical protein